MTREDRKQLLKDLCARLPYGVKVDHFIDLLRNEKDDITKELLGIIPSSENVMVGYDINRYEDSVIEDIKPYLRPMSSMTEEEIDDLVMHVVDGPIIYDEDTNLIIGFECNTFEQFALLENWLNEHHFDYRGLIEKGLALEAPEGMYKTE